MATIEERMHRYHVGYNLVGCDYCAVRIEKDNARFVVKDGRLVDLKPQSLR
jgi:hypothetical protein